jgi:ADP-ribose pyrophosphatase
MSIEVIARESIYQGHTFNVRVDKVRFENQHISNQEVVEHTGAVTLLPVDAGGNILFVRQYRHPVGKELLELPAGTFRKGEGPLDCARREIREETGYAAGDMTKVGEFFLAPGYSTEYMYVYVATNLTHDPLPGDADEDITLEPIPIAQAYDMALNGKLGDGKSLAALLLARPLIYKA